MKRKRFALKAKRAAERPNSEISFHSLALLVPAAALADDLSEERAEELVLEAICQNPRQFWKPRCLCVSGQWKRQAGQTTIVEGNRGALLNDCSALFPGNSGGDVTVVEFLDYSCPWCRQAKLVFELLLVAESKGEAGLRGEADLWRRLGRRGMRCVCDATRTILRSHPRLACPGRDERGFFALPRRSGSAH